ncbi:hypothetical protein K525DRAFT_255134 [Schizophyllum commune Loenen D]|nr:hypothetical protein K525DRAFT_255134 [Schizophyllum commune Loenen D]
MSGTSPNPAGSSKSTVASASDQHSPTHDIDAHSSAVGRGIDPTQNRQSERATTESAAPTNESYPEQKHAGAVGYGPAYHDGPRKSLTTAQTTGDKLTGLKEQVKGKVTGNHELARKGVERRTGELQKREQEADEQVCSGPIHTRAGN